MDDSLQSVTPAPAPGRVTATGSARVADLGARSVLRRLPDLPKSLGRLCRLAVRLSGADAALVVLRDEDRPFVAGGFGIPSDLDWGRTPLTLSLSEHSSATAEPLAIRDVGEHQLLSNDPLCEVHGYRSVLATPLLEGEASPGNLCLLGREPRWWDDDALSAAADVAASVVTEIRVRGSDRRVRDAERAGQEATMRSFVDLVDGLEVVIIERELATGRFTFVSRKAESLFGYPIERWTDDPRFWLEELVHPEDRKAVHDAIEQAMRDAVDVDVEYRVVCSDGRLLWIRDLVRIATRDPTDVTGVLRGVMVDITQQKEMEHLLRLLQELAVVGNDAESAEEAFRRTLDRFCRGLEWPVGHAWLVHDGTGGRATSSGVWYVAEGAEERTEAFRRHTAELTFAAGDGIPGHTWDRGEPMWVPDLARCVWFDRAEAAAEAGLGAAFAFPVRANGRTAAVLEIFAPRPTEPVERVERLGLHAGAILGRVVERADAENERAHREGQLSQAQRLARLGSWEWDVARDRVTWSEELHRIFGTDPADFDPTFEAYLARIHPEDRDLATEVVEQALESGDAFMFEHRVVHPDGTVLDVLSRGRVEVGDDGRAVRMMGTAQDISERKELEERSRQLVAEQAAREEAEAAEDRIKETLESIGDAFFAVDREWRFTYLNTQAERLLRQTRDELEGQVLWEAFPEALGGTFETEYRKAMEAQEVTEFEEYLEPVERWFEVRAFPSDRGLSVYFHDITQRKEADARLRASESRYRFLTDSLPAQIWTARPDGTLDYVNRVASEYFGLAPDEILDHGWQAVVHPDDLDRVARRWTQSLENGAPYEVEFRLKRADGEYRWHLGRARAQTTSDGMILKWFGANTDVHDQKELEMERDRALDDLERVTHLLSSERTNLEQYAKELRRTAQALERSNEELDQFAYVASHDLKAPLRGIANLAQWLADDLKDQLTDDTREYIELLQGRVQRMEALIDGILQYSRAGRVDESVVEVDVGELLSEIVDMLDPPAHFDVRIDQPMPTVLSERTPLEQVFINLIGNAIKHADGEDPAVRVSVVDENEDWIEFAIRDNGPGIDAEFHEKIWTIFQTLKPRDEVEGTGIGLSVVKRTVERQEGQVWVVSKPGEGATFHFLWPRRPPKSQESR